MSSEDVYNVIPLDCFNDIIPEDSGLSTLCLTCYRLCYYLYYFISSFIVFYFHAMEIKRYIFS